MFSVGYSKWDYASCSYAQSDDAADDTMWRMKNEPAEFWHNLRINRQSLKEQFRSLMDKVLATTLSSIRSQGFSVDADAQNFVVMIINHPLIEIMDEDSSFRACILKELKLRWRNIYYDGQLRCIVELV